MAVADDTGEGRDAPSDGAVPLLCVRDISKSFGSAKVLERVNFDVRTCAITGLIGPNGAGKTTLFNLIAGVETPDSGEIRVRGRSIAGLSSPARARLGVSRTFQEIRLFESLTAIENVMVGCRHNGGERLGVALFDWRRTGRQEAATLRASEKLLGLVGLAEHADRLPGEMSYGQQKRVGIARALATGMDLLCLDEPAAGLDPQATVDLVALIRSLRGEIGSILLVEHNLDLVRELCERLIFLDRGRIVVEGPPAAVLGDERVWRAFMGH